MKQALNNPWVVGTLCVMALVMVYFRLFDSKPKYEPPVQTVQAEPSSSVTTVSSPALGLPIAEAASVPEVAKALPIDVGWSEELGRDPFQPLRALGLLGDQELERNEEGSRDEPSRSTRRAMRLHAVFLNGPTKVAMIDRQLVKEGEQVGRFVVEKIQRGQVHLKGEEETRILEFSASPRNRRSSSKDGVS